MSGDFARTKEAVVSLLYAADGGGFARWCRASWAARPLPIALVTVFAWLASLLVVQLYGIAVDAGTVDRMQAASKARSAEARSGEGAGALAVWPASDGTARRAGWRGEEAPRPPRFLSTVSHRKPSTKNEGMGAATFENVVPRTGQRQATPASSSRDFAAAGGFERVQRVVYFPPRSVLGRGPEEATTADDSSDRRVIVEIACCLRDWLRTFRQEILGDGPWVMWFVPLPAKLAPEVQERVFGRCMRLSENQSR